MHRKVSTKITTLLYNIYIYYVWGDVVLWCWWCQKDMYALHTPSRWHTLNPFVQDWHQHVHNVPSYLFVHQVRACLPWLMVHLYSHRSCNRGLHCLGSVPSCGGHEKLISFYFLRPASYFSCFLLPLSSHGKSLDIIKVWNGQSFRTFRRQSAF